MKKSEINKKSSEKSIHLWLAFFLLIAFFSCCFRPVPILLLSLIFLTQCLKTIRKKLHIYSAQMMFSCLRIGQEDKVKEKERQIERSATKTVETGCGIVHLEQNMRIFCIRLSGCARLYSLFSFVSFKTIPTLSVQPNATHS